MKKPIATFVSDIHLALNPPACRAEEDWLAVQQRYLEQLQEIAQGSPVFIAGDLFDRWNPPPEVLHFAFKRLPQECYAVPGQHDLLNHRLDQMHRSGYGVLVAAGRIRDLSGGNTVAVGDLIRVKGCAWGEAIPPADSNIPTVLLAHRYVWREGRSHPGAAPEHHINRLDLKGYTWAVFGDNHQRFVVRQKGLVICNSGTFIRRKSDEIPLRPCVSVIDEDLEFFSLQLNTHSDQFREVASSEPNAEPLDLDAFIAGLEGLGEHGLNFREAVEQYVKNRPDLEPKVGEILLESLKHHEF